MAQVFEVQDKSVFDDLGVRFYPDVKQGMKIPHANVKFEIGRAHV